MSNIPNLYLIGAPKCGTTSFAHSLSLHPDIFMPKIKEPRYFDAHKYYDNEYDYPFKSLAEYLKLYNSKKAIESKYRLDASVFIMYSKWSIDRILSVSPNAKFILILRDPVTASISMHSQRLKYPKGTRRELSENFLECWKMIDERKKGLAFPDGCRNKLLFRYDLLYSYEKYLPYIISKIKFENLFIGNYEEYKNNYIEFFQHIYKFLNIKHIKTKKLFLNTRYIIRSSILLDIYYRIVQFTYPIRNKIGLTGGAISKFFLNFYKDSYNDKYDLTDVKKYFANTYIFLKKIKYSKYK